LIEEIKNERSQDDGDIYDHISELPSGLKNKIIQVLYREIFS
jgi:hypothetical protein